MPGRSNSRGSGARSNKGPKGPERRIVQQDPEGGWDVVKPGGKRVSAHADTQAEAIERARQILENAGGGELTIKGRDGKIRDSDTVPPGNDPNPPKDTT